jgi:hypothetical protein
MQSSAAFHRHFRETGQEGRKTMNNKNSNWKWNALVLAAAVAATAGTACAQDVAMKATVPFAFSINPGVNLAPGNYTVTRDRYTWQVQNEDTHQGVLIATAIGIEGKASEKPSLTFHCVNSHCQLRAIRMGGGALGAQVPVPKLSKSDAAELAVVNVQLEPNRGE